ncbi:GGDEF domain-containing protein [Rhodoferax koreense]|uniref:GGDEF domain-containing protein n=1 Tax=Rhodoferax koreensis TaxID=1842727 RepID=A0A1P8JR76_9BURK|nr:EAL domain-containing protein [Rhodoferax koreense]APW36239.1 GGDEF domain-containing protein [Rhodoferax koreense]
MKWWPAFADWRLSTRIVILSLALLLVVQATSLLVVHASIERNARNQVARELAIAERIFRSLVDQRTQRLSQGAAVLSTDFGFRAAVNSHDTETIKSALDNHGDRTGAKVAAFLDTSLKPLAVNDGETTLDAALLRQIATPLQNKDTGSQLAVIGGRPYLFVMVPMRAPVLIGWILMGFPTEQALVDNLYQLSGARMALQAVDSAGPASIVMNTLPPENLRDLLKAGLGVTEFRSQGDTLIIRHLSLSVIGGELDLLLLHSLEQAVGPFNQLQLTLLVITGLGLLLFGLGSAWTARRVTTPLRSLVEAAERLGEGHYDQRMEHMARRDEIGDLANAFDRMRMNIAISQNEIQQLAYWDRLTRLPNRVRFRDAVKEAIATRQEVNLAQRSPLAVVTLNLDRFKHVNDVLGYALGDRLLKAVAERLLIQVEHQEAAVVARLGGDEFAVLLPTAGAAAAMAVAQRIVRSFEIPLTYDDQTVDLSASIGIACWPEHAVDVDALLSRAEIAMYTAKRNTTVTQLYDAALDSSSTQTLSLLSELRHAVQNHELRVFLQPKISLKTGEVVAAEALVRWQHPTRGLIPPMAFIPFAEQTGFIRQITLWVFDEVARQWDSLQPAAPRGQPLRVAINLSTRDLMDPDFPAKLAVLLATHGASSASFCLEITESAIMDDPLRAETTLNQLSELGFKLSIDDFGTGYSSLAYLKRLPVDELKIDKSFVMGMGNDPDDGKIVRSTIDLAHNLGLNVVAEGVETAAAWELLRELSCDEAQGYHMGKPMPVAEFPAWRERWLQRYETENLS